MSPETQKKLQFQKNLIFELFLTKKQTELLL